MANNIFLSLDELFDVRSTVWHQLVGADTFVSMLNENYAIRTSDRWDKYVPYATYLDAYSKRDAATLRNSSTSNIIPVIKVALNEGLVNFATNPMEKTPIIYLNVTKRYALSDEELNAIGGALMTALEVDTPIRITRIEVPLPRDFKQMSVGLVLMYDVLTWIGEMVGKTILDETSMCPDTTILSAEVHTSDQPYNQKTFQRACHEVVNTCRVLADIGFISAAMFTSPILVNIHSRVPQSGEPESSS